MATASLAGALLGAPIGPAFAAGQPAHAAEAAEVWVLACARCHGERAEHIVPSIGRLSDAELDAANLEMLIGPGAWGDDAALARELTTFLRGLANQPEPARTNPVSDGAVRESGMPTAEQVLARDDIRQIAPDPSALRAQLAIAAIDESATPPTLRRTTAGDLNQYFYPASSIKLCAAVAALQMLEDIQASGIPATFDTPLVYHPRFDDEELEARDDTNLRGGTITIAHEIRKLFIDSDNRAFNRLYEFVGHAGMNERMWAAGLGSVRINHRLAESRTAEQNRSTPRIELLLPDGSRYEIPQRQSDLMINNAGVDGLLVGQAEMVGGRRREGPKDFTHSNRINLLDLQDAVVMLVRPDVDLGKPGFGLREEHRQLLLRAMGELPRESLNPVYDPHERPDEWVKFMLPGVRDHIPDARVLNKIGLAYGFTTETAWISGGASPEGIFIAGTIYTNSDGLLNDDAYDYDEVAFPFWRAVGRAVGEATLP